MVSFTETGGDVKTRPSPLSTGAAFLDGPISADYYSVSVMDTSKEVRIPVDSCDCSDSCFIKIPKTGKKKAQHLSGWSVPPALAEAQGVRV
jgi:hypothetical protein